MMAQPLVFVHIPKTAGKTLQALIRKNVPAEQQHYFHITSVEQAQSVLNDIPGGKSVYYGHIPYTQEARHAFPTDSRYITTLREPIARSVSNYNFMRDNPSHPMYHRIHNEHISLDNYMEQLQDHWPFDNLQVRMLSHAFGKPFMGLDHSDLELAYRALENDFLLFGMVEQFDLFCLDLAQVLSWKKIHVARQNRSGNRSAYSLSPAQKDALARCNLLDMELYSRAKRLLAERNRVPSISRWKYRIIQHVYDLKSNLK